MNSSQSNMQYQPNSQGGQGSIGSNNDYGLPNISKQKRDSKILSRGSINQGSLGHGGNKYGGYGGGPMGAQPYISNQM